MEPTGNPELSQVCMDPIYFWGMWPPDFAHSTKTIMEH